MALENSFSINFSLFQLEKKHNLLQTMLVIWFRLENIFWEKKIKKTAISKYFVSLQKVCYWEENISKQIEIPSLLTVFLLVPLKTLPWKRDGSFLTIFLSVPLKKLPWKRSGSFLLPYKSLEIKRWFTQKMKVAQKIAMGTKINYIVPIM